MGFIAGYLFVTFSGEDLEGEQVYFSLSRDGFYWWDLTIIRESIYQKW